MEPLVTQAMMDAQAAQKRYYAIPQADVDKA